MKERRERAVDIEPDKDTKADTWWTQTWNGSSADKQTTE